MRTGEIIMETKNEIFLNSRYKRHFETLKHISRDLIPCARARIAACVVYKNEIVSFGVNRRKSHPLQAKYSRNQESIFLHAEISAINNALRYMNNNLERCNLLIYRAKIVNGIWCIVTGKQIGRAHV